MKLIGKDIRLVAAVLGAATLLTASAGAASKSDRPAGDPRSPQPVFVLEKGRFSAFDAPGTGSNELVDINSRGQIAGTYVDAEGASHAFLRDKGGRFTLFDVPGATQTFVLKLNSKGQIAGNACDESPCESRRGYLRDANGRYTTIRVPGSVQTQAYGLDDRGRIVGDYTEADGSVHGYLWENGHFTTIDGPEGTGATLTGINDRRQMVGIYLPRGAAGLQGFLLAKGVYRRIEDPRLAFTLPFDINERGQVVGASASGLPPRDAAEVHGFLLTPGRNGRFIRIDVPGAPENRRDRDRRPRPHRRPLREPERRADRAAQQRQSWRWPRSPACSGGRGEVSGMRWLIASSPSPAPADRGPRRGSANRRQAASAGSALTGPRVRPRPRAVPELRGSRPRRAALPGCHQ